MMATLMRLGIFAVTVVIPGGFLLLPLYLAHRALRAPRALDFEAGRRRVPHTRQPPPRGTEVRRMLRRLGRDDPMQLSAR